MKIKIALFTMVLILATVLYIINAPHRMKRISQWLQSESVKKEIPVRGSIITADNVTIAYTQKVYHLSLLSGVFNRDEFSKLMDKMSRVVKVNKGHRTLSYFKEIKKEEFRIVAYALNEEQMQKVQIILDTFKKPEEKAKQYYAFTLSGEKRVYPYKDMLTPVIGYNHKLTCQKNFTCLKGVQGIEKFYNDTLSSQNRHSKPENILLNIDFKLQQQKEKELDKMKSELSADEVISVVLDTGTFKVKAIASSNRFDPKHIKREDFSNLTIHATQYKFALGDFKHFIKQAIEEEKEFTAEDGYKRFGLKDENETVSFMQLVKMYGVFYAQGKIADVKIVNEKNVASSLRQIISKKNALNIRNTLSDFFNTMKDKTFEFKYRDKTLSATIYMQEFKKNSKNYLEAYFIINTYNIDKYK